MNERVWIAQADTTPVQNPAPLKVVTVVKPGSEQAITIDLGFDQKTKVDLSAVASEKMTMVHIGTKLIVLFDNHSTVTIEPFFDSTGKPLANLDVNLGAGHDVTGDQFASLFPITEDQSVLPAAGGGGSPASGADFHSPTVDPLAIGNPLPLLGPEELGNFQTIAPLGPQSNFIDTAPGITLTPTGDNINLDDGHNLADEAGITGGVGQAAGSRTGDGSNETQGTFTLSDVDGVADIKSLTINGTVVTVAELAAAATTPVTVDGHYGTLKITDYDPNTGIGHYTYILTKSEADTAQGPNIEPTPDSFTFVVTDNSNVPSPPATLLIDIKDDVPSASFSGTTFTQEAANSTGDFVPQSAHGQLEFTTGADGATVTGVTYRFGAAVLDQDDHTFVPLTSHGDAVAISSVTDHGVITLTGTANGTTVFTLTVDQTTGAYEFKQFAPLDQPDHDQTGTDDYVRMVFDFTVTDGDGDTATNAFQVDIRDDGPTLVGQNVTYHTDEGDIFTVFSHGSSPDDGHADGSYTGSTTHDVLIFLGGGPAETSGSVLASVNFGADGEGGFSFASNAARTLAAEGLSSKGTALTYSVSGDTLTASANGHTIFTLSLNETTGDFVFKLYDQLDHVAPTTPDTADYNTDLQGHDSQGHLTTVSGIDFGSVIVATDGDGDSVTLNGHLTIDVTDDVPHVLLAVNPAIFVGIDESAGSQDGFLGAPPNDTTGSTTLGHFTAFETANASELGNDTDIAHVAGSPAIAYAHGLLPVVTPVVINGGADGVASVVYSLQAASAGVYSGVQTTDGHNIYLYEDAATGLIVGRVGGADAAHDDADANGTIAFAIAIEQNGDIDIAQYLSLKETNTHDNNDTVSLIDGAIRAVITVTDGDGDVATDTANIGSHILFYDDGPVAKNDTASVTEHQSVQANVISNDTVGADGAHVSAIAFTGHSSSAATPDATHGDGFVIDGKYGELTIYQDGYYNYTANPNISNASPVTDKFTYTLTDGDGDSTTATLTISVSDGAIPTVEGSIHLTVNEAALDKTIESPDLAPGLVTGTNPSSSAETDQKTGITFTAHSDNITGITFGNVANNGTVTGIHVEGADPTATFTWTFNAQSHQLEGHLGGSNGPVAIILAIGGDTTADADGIGTDHTAVPTVTTTLTDDFPHADGTGDITVTGITLVATDTDGDHVASANVDVTIVDDVPTAEAAMAAPLDDEALTDGIPGTPGVGDLPGANSFHAAGDLSFNAGADGLKSIAITGLSVTDSANNSSGSLHVLYVDPITHIASAPELVTFNWDSATHTYVGTSDHYGADNPAITVSVDQTGHYEVTVNAPLDHPFTTADNTVAPGTEWEDDLTLNFTYQVTDGDNDTTTSTLSVKVNDDSPMANQTVSGSVNEADVKTQPGDLQQTTIDFSNVVANQPIAPYLGQYLTANSATLGTAYGTAFGLNASIIISATDNAHPFEVDHLNISVAGPNQAMTVWLYGYDANNVLVAKESITVSGATSLGNEPSSLFVAGTGPDGFAGKEIVRLEIARPEGLENQTYVQIDNLVVGTGTAASGEVTPAHTEIDLSTAAVFGADGQNAAGGFQFRDVHGADLDGITSGGSQIKVETVGDKLIGYTGSDTSDPVFTLEIVDGQAVFKLYHTLDHTGQQDLTLDFGKYILAVDGDGDAVGIDLSVNVHQGPPPLVAGSDVTGTVEEEQLGHLANPAYPSSSVGNEDTGSASGNDHDTTADFNITTNAATGTLSVTGGTGPYSFAFSSGLDGHQAAFTDGSAVTSGGQPVLYSIQGTTLTGYVNSGAAGYTEGTDHVVFTITLGSATSTDGNDGYTFTLYDHLDHDGTQFGDNQEGTLSLDLSDFVTVTDSSGSNAPVTLNGTIDVIDDTPVLGDIQSISVNDGQVHTGAIDFHAGADGVGSEILSGTPPANLMSGGEAVKYWVSTDGHTLIGYTGSDPSGGNQPDHQVFTLTLDADGHEYSYQQLQAFDSTLTTTTSLGDANHPFDYENQPAGEVDVTYNGGTIAQVTGSGDVNGSESGFGVDANKFTAGDVLHFDFSQSDTGTATSSVTFSFTKAGGVDYVVHYSDNSSDSVYNYVATKDGTLTFTAPTGATIDYVEFTGNNHTPNGGFKVVLDGVNVETTTQLPPADLGFNVTLTDGDGDAVHSTINVNVDTHGNTPPTVAEPPAINHVEPGIYYAFTNDGLTPNDIAFNAHDLFSSSHDMTFQFSLVSGSDSWLTVTDGTAGTVTANDVGGIGPNAATGATIFLVEATDSVTHLSSSTYVAFTALGGTAGVGGYDQNAQGNLYDGGGFLTSGNNGSVYIAADGGSTINGSNWADAIYGSEKADNITTGNANNGGANYVDAGGGNDIVNGGNNMDVLLGGDGNDTIHGYDGNDILVGGLGNDTLTGGHGNDTFVFAESGESNKDTITDFNTGSGNYIANEDKIDLSALLEHLYGAGNATADDVRVITDPSNANNVALQVDVDTSTAGQTWENVASLANYNQAGHQVSVVLDHMTNQQHVYIV